MITNEVKNYNDIASRVVTSMHNLDAVTVNKDKEMSVEALKHIDAMLRKNEIDFYIIWVIGIEERTKRFSNKKWIPKDTKKLCMNVNKELKIFGIMLMIL